MLPDSELINRVQLFDQKAMAEVYDTFSPALYRYAMRLLGDQDLAEDCVADTFMRFLKIVRSKHGPRQHLQAYLFRMAHNWIVDHYRSGSKVNWELKESQKDFQDSPEETVQLHLRQERLRSILHCLTANQLQVIMLRYFEGWDYEEIARAVEKPTGAVKALQHRAFETLRQKLKEENLI